MLKIESKQLTISKLKLSTTLYHQDLKAFNAWRVTRARAHKAESL
jgi:hypothetical protein